MRARVWDFPTRLTHWMLVGLIPFSWWSAEDHLDWHRLSGISILGLVIFRILWGFAGGEAARFRNFLRGPTAAITYAMSLRTREATHTTGHNPLGGWSVIAILSTLATQTVTGMFAGDIDGLESGPLAHLVSFELSRAMAGWHEVTFRVLQALVVLHLAAVAYYHLWRRADLIGPMISGSRRLQQDPGLRFAPLWRAIVGAALAAAIATWISLGAPLPLTAG